MSQFQKESNGFPSRSRSNGRRAGRRSLGRVRGGGDGKGGGGQKKFRFFTWKWFFLVILTTILLAIGGCSAVVMSAPTYNIEEIEEKMEESSTIYDTNEKEVMKLGASNREYVKIGDIKSPELAKAFVKVEDERFYQHNGIDYRGFGRAIFRNIISLGKAEGASTITMQVARNAVLKDRNKTYTRKLNEIAVSLNLERKYEKDRILETYINYIDLGNDVRGVKMAAKIYFDKDITKDELEPEEIALLAGLPKAPYGYDPFTKEENALNRRNVVLNKLAEDKGEKSPPLFSEAEVEAAKKKPLAVDPEYVQKHLPKNSYGAYKDYLFKELKERYSNIPEDELRDSGYKIYTSLNAKAQKATEAALKDEKNQYFVDQETGQPLEGLDAGLTIMNPSNGEIVAMGGGRHYMPGYMNRATQRMQPGSIMKPISVYAPAVEQGFNEYHIVKDDEIKIGEWSPQNYTGEFYGDVELQESVARSLNASAVWLLQEHVTLKRAYDTAVKAGLTLNEKDGKSIAAMSLGGLTDGVNTVEMAQAYSAFPNNGVNHEPHTVRKVENNEGTEVQPAVPIKKDNKVFSPQTAWYTTRMLQYAVDGPVGTGTNAQLDDGRPVAGKTGTTQNAKEAWFAGFTPQYVGVVTVFNDQGSTVRLSGGGYPARIWKAVMTEVMAGLDVKNFDRPKGVKDPEPPFQLSPPNVSGSYNADAKAIDLKWSDAGDRVKYEVQRSEDNNNWSTIGETEGGSYSDNSIEVPESGFFDGLFGGGAESKSYFYKVVAIDKQAEGGDARAESNVVEVKLTPDAPPPEEEEQPDQQPEEEQGEQPEEPDGGDQIQDQLPNDQGGGSRGNNGGRDQNDNGNDDGGGFWP
ncbi:transglycosylase domain-containing protein [Desmospora activa]|uniref:Penicillin-binding protein 1A/penicillin-binding protein 2A n=1 Tax=Desmospora activa DSM 45169 TaxID=1121389 RepID=A0A2T4Z6J5_9BACL|nr:transglycosylase domain-containing protein [Desmospora activa]PTM57501.1 penicillin-binding protein 1A/penicillin-binding protein 2A [Desmospora activa DSM 45169]